ncbi:MAG: hypothetical protein ABW277_14135 [Longimicrobiaceae bacterium]
MPHNAILDWDPWYFFGYSDKQPSKIELHPEEVGFFFSAAGIDSGLSWLAPIDPRHLMNSKGTTAWHALFVYALWKDEDEALLGHGEALLAAFEGRTLALAPAASLRSSFSSHVNWPEQMLRKYDLGLDIGFPFVVPFLVPVPAPKPRSLNAPLRSPGGDMVVHGVERFDEDHPEHLLATFQELKRAIAPERGDLSGGGLSYLKRVFGF